LIRHGVEYDAAMSLPHKYPVVNSIQKTSIELVDDKIIAKAPFKKEFLKELRDIDFPFIEWVKESKQYELPFDPKSLNRIKTLMEKHFVRVEVCDKVKTILTEVNKYKDARIWDPSLVYRNNQLLIYGLNQSLYNAINDIPLELNCTLIAKLINFGIKIDDTVVNKLSEFENPDKIKIALDHYLEVDFDLQPNIFTWLKELGCDAIYFNDSSRVTKLITDQHIESIKNSGITLMFNAAELHSYNNPVILTSMVDFSFLEEKHIFKRIRWLSSKPIKLK
jgi:hypothetical protein